MILLWVWGQTGLHTEFKAGMNNRKTLPQTSKQPPPKNPKHFFSSNYKIIWLPQWVSDAIKNLSTLQFYEITFSTIFQTLKRWEFSWEARENKKGWSFQSDDTEARSAGPKGEEKGSNRSAGHRDDCLALFLSIPPLSWSSQAQKLVVSFRDGPEPVMCRKSSQFVRCLSAPKQVLRQLQQKMCDDWGWHMCQHYATRRKCCAVLSPLTALTANGILAFQQDL